MKTIAELQTAIRERSVTVTIHEGSSPGPAFVVWLYAPDDPIVNFQGEGDSLENALTHAVQQWDQDQDEEPGEEPPQEPEPN